MEPRLILVLGDQLTLDRAALADARPGMDTVLMAEVADEANYTKHNRHKLAFIFAAMRHFRDELQARGFTVEYLTLDDNIDSLCDALDQVWNQEHFAEVVCCEPGEFRVQSLLDAWSTRRAVPLKWTTDDRFLCDRDTFDDWASGRKQLRMEYFYRLMRRRYSVLMEGDKPAGGQWNYDKENRKGWRNKHTPPPLCASENDPVLDEVISLVNRRFPDNPGDLDTFHWAVTRPQALQRLQHFASYCLPLFGTYQDAMAEDFPWLYHSLLSPYLNVGLLDPLEVCEAVEDAWREGHCELSAAEGFIRQILGWREYVRGIYWYSMPEYAQRNGLEASAPLPAFFWNADTDLHCLHKALDQSLQLGYAHHIQRLMVIGNFALLTGLDVAEVCDWYLGVYIDAFEWVELPNTLGMALSGDNGLMASKPYAATGKYIQRQGDHCKHCRYKPTQTTGDGACPYNSLYWAFLHRHEVRFSNNPRMGLAMRNWQRKPESEQTAILAWAGKEQARLAPARRAT
ncbi:cryptochrome/photolyase family protein [Halioglobus japonicus]|uniref:Cryptochrome/photolyase family protein n=1 Tax=Halioglobus japonicus TaxID=930805 RepID=A0AAP8SN40_9GAMM|nr:cryptochrome/photolyase family protein [Halioglobus japonicus]AQA18214.1 cryptochrome/photolyase family protein [Halioglobus japonicus]PLW86222.1 cryptochrome/photolyase family protein [Halioglobus japonicus]GHD13855.1 deoxyribodipyrimidine photo-lyase [Halioglobus japonicus]